MYDEKGKEYFILCGQKMYTGRTEFRSWTERMAMLIIPFVGINKGHKEQIEIDLKSNPEKTYQEACISQAIGIISEVFYGGDPYYKEE